MIEIFLSSDGKNTVRVQAEEGKVTEAYKQAKLVFDRMLEDYPGTKLGQAMDKAEKETKLGNCDKCGAPMAWSAKSNKAYCSNLCWKK